MQEALRKDLLAAMVPAVIDARVLGSVGASWRSDFAGGTGGAGDPSPAITPIGSTSAPMRGDLLGWRDLLPVTKKGGGE